AAVVALTLMSLFVLARLIWPVDRLEALLLGCLLVAFAIALAVPFLSDLFKLERPPDAGVVIVAVVVATSILGFLVLLRVAQAVGLAGNGDSERVGDDDAGAQTVSSARSR
ncbi:MAG TPA: hypothetical protein VGK49_07695, partial [Ilumatobacteraceae bacterium]